MKKMVNGKYYDLTPEEIAAAEAKRKEMETQMPPPQPTTDDVLNALFGVTE